MYRITRGPGMDASLTSNGIIGSADLAGAPTLLIGFTTPKSRFVDPSEWLAGWVIVHEAFHIYQHQLSWDIGPAGQPMPLEYPRDEENAALVLLEDAVLKVSPGQLPIPATHTLHTFLAIRAARLDRLPEVDRRDRYPQQFEGTARFVEERYARLGGHQIPDRWPGEFATGFELLDRIADHRGYYVGAACGELLESVDGPSWRRQVPRAKGPADIAATIVGVPSGEHRDRLIDQAKQTFDYPKLVDNVRRVDLPNATLPER